MSIAPIHPQNFPFIYYGRPLALSEEKGKFVPLWKQQATDEKGRKRFHGAFTGGFTAGYHNTVGSKEGWRPSEYKRNTTENRETRLLSIMDEEDISDYAQADHHKLPSSRGSIRKPSTSNLKIVPIISDQHAKQQHLSVNFPSLQILAQAKALMAEGQLENHHSAAHFRGNEIIDDDEHNYEGEHCYGSPIMADDGGRKLSAKKKLSIAPFELRVYEALSRTDVALNEDDLMLSDILVTPQCVPESFRPMFKSDHVDGPLTSTASILTPTEANAALSSSYEPFSGDSEKQRRYRLFLQSIVRGNSILLEEDKLHEMKEFHKAALMFRPLSQEMAQRFIPSAGTEESRSNQKEISKMMETTTVGERGITWIPSSILCKRLGIDPPSSQVEHVPQKFVKEILDRDTMHSMLKALSSTSTSTTIHVLDMESEAFVSESISAFELRPEPEAFKELFNRPVFLDAPVDLSTHMAAAPSNRQMPLPSESNPQKKKITTKMPKKLLSFD